MHQEHHVIKIFDLLTILGIIYLDTDKVITKERISSHNVDSQEMRNPFNQASLEPFFVNDFFWDSGMVVHTCRFLSTFIDLCKQEHSRSDKICLMKIRGELAGNAFLPKHYKALEAAWNATMNRICLMVKLI